MKANSFPFIFLVINYFAVNLGGLLLQALLEYWPRTHVNPMDEEENEVNHGACFSIRIIDLKLLRNHRDAFQKQFRHLPTCDTAS